jgi:hypothetical protein
MSVPARPKGARTGRDRARPAAASAPARARSGVLPAASSRFWVVLVLTVHVALACWAAARNSVTFDENFHLPAGVVIVTRGEFHVSEVNPPLVKALCGLAAVAAGARPPDLEAVTIGDQALVGASFMRANADRYHSVFFAARLVIVLISVILGFWIWRHARRLYGARAALLALVVYAFLPESLAHGSVVTMDVATGLGFLASVVTFARFLETGRPRHWAWCGLAVSSTFLIRFTATLLFPIFALLFLIGIARSWVASPRRALIGLALLVPCVVLALDIGYLGQVSFEPLIQAPYGSLALQRLQYALPQLRLPLPDSFLAGFDHQLFENQGEGIPTFLLGKIHANRVWYYYPLAVFFKWPLAFLGLIVGRVLIVGKGGGGADRRRQETPLLVTALAFLASVVFFGQLNFGVRYLFPMIPMLCIWIGGWLRDDAGPRTATASAPRARIARTLALLLVIETAATAPWFLAFFNWPSGGPGGGDRLVNDSNVDWGQGLIALRDEMRKRGIQRLHLAYHGTTDPAVYGIDYVPWFGGTPGPESDWLAISSFYYVGQSQRMMTPQGRTDFVRIDATSLRSQKPVARPAHCMYLFRIRGAGGFPQ